MNWPLQSQDLNPAEILLEAYQNNATVNAGGIQAKGGPMTKQCMTLFLASTLSIYTFLQILPEAEMCI